MNARRCYWSALVAALALVPSRAFTQSEEGKRTPRPDDVRPPITNPEDSLSRRLGKDRELTLNEKTIQTILNGLPEDFKEKIRNDPELKKRALEELRNNTKLRDDLAAMDKKKLAEMGEKLIGKKPAITEPPITQRPDMGTTTQPVEPADPKTGPMTPPGTTPADPPTSASPSGAKPGGTKADEPSGLKKLFTKALPKAADLMSQMGLTEDADFLRALFRGKVLDENGGYLAKLARKGLAVGKELPLEKLLSGDFSAIVGDHNLPNLPHFNFSLGGNSPPGDAGGSFPGITAAGSGMVFFWVLVLIVLAVFLWKGKELFLPSAARTAGAWKLGPWPVRPERVRTRADLIKAFEYLAFLLIGLAARPRNHLDLALNLADTGTEPGRQGAADRLARLYERARYAPAEEMLPDDELRAARHDLTFLAGVGGA